jgi:hypothetical protein
MLHPALIGKLLVRTKPLLRNRAVQSQLSTAWLANVNKNSYDFVEPYGNVIRTPFREYNNLHTGWKVTSDPHLLAEMELDRIWGYVEQDDGQCLTKDDVGKAVFRLQPVLRYDGLKIFSKSIHWLVGVHSEGYEFMNLEDYSLPRFYVHHDVRTLHFALYANLRAGWKVSTVKLDPFDIFGCSLARLRLETFRLRAEKAIV